MKCPSPINFALHTQLLEYIYISIYIYIYPNLEPPISPCVPQCFSCLRQLETIAINTPEPLWSQAMQHPTSDRHIHQVPVLGSLSFVDTPGVLSGDKQRMGRSYDFEGAMGGSFGKWTSITSPVRCGGELIHVFEVQSHRHGPCLLTLATIFQVWGE